MFLKIVFLVALILDAAVAGAVQQTAPTPSPAPAAPSLAHFHHLHLNSTDPAAAINFYASKFDCEKTRFNGNTDAVWAQKSWILFNKARKPPKSEITSAIWHIGWGAEDM